MLKKIRWYMSFLEDVDSVGSKIIESANSCSRYLPIARSPARINVHLWVVVVVGVEGLSSIKYFAV